MSFSIKYKFEDISEEIGDLFSQLPSSVSEALTTEECEKYYRSATHLKRRVELCSDAVSPITGGTSIFGEVPRAPCGTIGRSIRIEVDTASDPDSRRLDAEATASNHDRSPKTLPILTNSGSGWKRLSSYPNTQKNLVKYDSVYESDNGQFWIVDREEKWIKVSETAVRRKLNQEFYLKSKSEDGVPSEIQVEIREITEARNVSFACSLAGYRRGVHEIESGERILVTDDPKLIVPKKGEWNTIYGFLSQLLGEEQLGYFVGWLSVAVCALHERKITQGQALIIAGPADCGKTFLQDCVITPILGGRSARPYQMMTGQTSFNADMFLAEHQVVSDEVPKTDLNSRRAFGTFLKDITSNPNQRLHAKGKNARVLRPFWRLSVSLNDEIENLAMLPILEESILDKIMLFRADKPGCLPRTHDERGLFGAAINRELPAFVEYLQGYEIPRFLQSGRFGVKHFINPSISDELALLSPEAQLLDIVDAVMFPGLSDETNELTATQFYTKLVDSSMREAAKRLLPNSSQTGKYLQRLAKPPHSRVTSRLLDGSTRYTVRKASLKCHKGKWSKRKVLHFGSGAILMCSTSRWCLNSRLTERKWSKWSTFAKPR